MNDDSVFEPLRRNEIVGRHIGSPDFIKSMEKRTGRVLQACKRGPMEKVENTKK